MRQADANPKDPQAEQLIRAKTAALPSAPYLLAQAVSLQEHALANAQARIAELENRVAAVSYIFEKIAIFGNPRSSAPVCFTTSPSGDHAWNVIKGGHARVDLVLTDIVMPGWIDGFALAAKVCQRELKLPVLFMTGALPEGAEHLAEITRKKLLLRKPFSPKQLVEFIDSHLYGTGAGE